MSEMDYEAAASYWDGKERAEMPSDQVRAWVEAFLGEKGVCALATGAGGYVRCTPLEFSYHDGAVWIFTEGGRKFVGLAKNKRVSVAVFDQDPGFGSLRSVQIQGMAEVVEPMSDGYIAHAEHKKVPVAALQKLVDAGRPMNLLRIVPSRADVLCSEFKAQGFDSRQVLEF